MAKDVIMPVLGMNQDTAVLLNWLKQEGEQVEEGEPIMEVETDKATMELDAPASGTLARVTARAGEEVKVGSVIAVILADGEAVTGATNARDAGAAGTAQTRAEGSWERPGGDGPPGAPGVGAAGSERATAQGAVARNGSGARPGAAAAGAGPAAAVAGRVPASPKARRLAGEHGIDLASLRGAGSGPEGAILAADVLRAVERRPQTSAATATTSTAPAAWTTFQRELDAAPLLQALARTRGARKGADGAPAIDVGDLLARFLGAVWSRHPLAGGEQDSVRMRYRRLADGRLQAALIEDAGRASVLGIAAARETAEPVGAGREGAGTAGDATELSLLDLTRARVDLGGDAATPGALVSVVAGRLDERVVAANGAPELRTTFTLRLAFDPTHVELASAAAWADRVIELAEDPSALALLY